MDSLVCAMSVMTPSEIMRRMKYWEPSVTADAYLRGRRLEVKLIEATEKQADRKPGLRHITAPFTLLLLLSKPKTFRYHHTNKPTSPTSQKSLINSFEMTYVHLSKIYRLWRNVYSRFLFHKSRRNIPMWCHRIPFDYTESKLSNAHTFLRTNSDIISILTWLSVTFQRCLAGFQSDAPQKWAPNNAAILRLRGRTALWERLDLKADDERWEKCSLQSVTRIRRQDLEIGNVRWSREFSNNTILSSKSVFFYYKFITRCWQLPPFVTSELILFALSISATPRNL